LNNNIQPMPIVKNKFKEFIIWYQNQDNTKQSEYWKNYLDGFEAKTILPIENSIKSTSLNQSKSIFKLSKELAERISRLCKQHKITTAAFMYAAWGILLQKYSNSDDVVFGTTVSGRKANIKGIENIVGLFINTIPLRIKNDNNNTISSMLAYVDKMLKDRDEYENTPLVDIKTAIGFDYQSNVFDSIVVMENYPLDKELNNGSSAIKIEEYSMYEATNFDLVLSISMFDDIELGFIYNSNSFEKSSIQNAAGHFENIIKAMVKEQDINVSKIDVLSEAERDRVIFDFNATDTNYPKDKTLHELFEEQVEKAPDNVAVTLGQDFLTYKQLNEKANQFAKLLRSKGVKANSIVAMIVDRSIDMIVGIIAILKAGGAYLPIDPTYPMDRIDYMLKDSGANILITQNHLLNKVEFDGTIIDINAKSCYIESTSNLEHINKSSDLAYVIYTSGSTGKPKGSLTMHYNISRVVKETNYIAITDKDNVLQLSNYAFDGSTFDIYGALLNGAKLVMLDRDTVIDIDKLSTLIKEQEISVFFVTTALFNTLVDLDIKCLKNIRKILFGGERVSLLHTKKALEYMGKDKIIHVYGPTESTVYASYYAINDIDEKLGTVPIGSPLSNTQLYVMDKNNTAMPIGVPGELCISGDGLAKGYLNRPELTAEKFVQNPYVQGELMYKTGDLVRWLIDGNIEFIGRIDHQVKIRGFRIELGEIESQLFNYKDIKEAIVIAREDNTGNHYISAYISAASEVNIPVLKENLLKTLPEYMIPAYIIQLERLPLTLNGKVDRKALPEPNTVIAGVEFEAPTNEIEEKLAEVWKQVLGIDIVGINHNFFELGGHSLKATNAVSRIHKATGVQVPLKQFFAMPTIKQLTLYIQDQEKSLCPTIKAVESKEYYEVSCAQRSLFLQQQFEGIATSYNMPIAMLIDGKLDVQKLNSAFNELVKRHEALRTSFLFIEEKTVQRIHNDIEFNIINLELESNNIDEIINQFVKPFDLGKAPLIRVGVKQISEYKHVLIMDMHHIISDGISVNIMMKELSSFYEGKQLELKTLSIQYKDYAEWQSMLFDTEYMEKQKLYWHSNLIDELPVLNMPTDFIRSDNRTFEGDTVKFSISSHLKESLNQIARKNDTTLNTVLFSIYTILLNRYSNQEDIVIGSLSAGRTQAEIQNIIGMFNNFLPIRNKIDSKNSFMSFVNATKEVMLNAYENQEYPYDKMVESFANRNDISRNPLFDTMLILHNQLEAGTSFKMDTLTFKRYEYDSKTSKLDFKLDAYIDELDELSCILEYNTRLYNASTIERLATHFVNIAKEIVENPYKKLCEIQMIAEEEKQLILGEFNNTKAEYQKDKTLYQLF
ncbi:MAG: amino acid adenylation domain-containing protein, partial [Lutisporaceae bacterium]